MSLFDDLVAQMSNVVSLAEGGQKKVFAAQHPEFGSVVIKHGVYRYTVSLERISREVDLLRDLSSKYYPKNFEFIVEPVQREFLVVEERLDAVELGQARHRFSDDTSILVLLRHLICALNAIWKRNVVHRDLKPANILVTPENEPRIIDLGIARFLDEDSITRSLAPMGPATPIYAAPEQLMNKKAMINPRTDFFLLALLSLELVHGYHPFDPAYVGNQQSLVENISTGTYVPPPDDCATTLATFIDKNLSTRPFQRIRTVESVMRYLNMDDSAC